MASEAELAEQRFALLLRDTRGTGIKLLREPQGDEFAIPPGGELEIRAEGPVSDHMEIDIGSDSVVVWGWSGSVVEIYRNGVRLSHGSLPVPPVPKGMSVRGFLGKVLGQPTEPD